MKEIIKNIKLKRKMRKLKKELKKQDNPISQYVYWNIK